MNGLEMLEIFFYFGFFVIIYLAMAVKQFFGFTNLLLLVQDPSKILEIRYQFVQWFWPQISLMSRLSSL